MNLLKRIPWLAWLALAAVLLSAALLAALDGSADWLRGFIAYAVLLGLSAASLLGAARLVGAEDKTAVAAALTSFTVRLAVGTALFLLLPVVGYADSVEHQTGYVFTDARIRDQQAWELAASSDPLSQAFSGRFSGDQYGGLLALSAVVYRLLSPDFHRPLLIVILGAAAAAWGVLLLWKASRNWFDPPIARAAAWIFALYPESVLLGSSQMREPFVIAAVAMALLGISVAAPRRWAFLGWLAAAAVILFTIQPLAGMVAFGLAVGLWLLEPGRLRSGKRAHFFAPLILLIGALALALVIAASVLANLPSLQGSGPFGVLAGWLQNNFAFQSYLAERASGQLQRLLDIVGEDWEWLVILVYGIAQPVLPSVVGDPGAAPVMRLIGFLRAAGWYALAPFLVYGVMGVLRARHEARRLQLAWLAAATWGWIAIAALNAGGDQWDNPRYRAILLAAQAILAAWAWHWARSRHDRWLGRWLAVEAVFVGLFTEWYVSRYVPSIPHPDIRIIIIATLVIAALILGGGWLYDRKHPSR